MVSHWLQFETDEPFVPNLKKFGFVYLIINTQNGKGYVGCKQYFAMNKKKTKHKWETYTGSSKYLNADIKKIGKENFRFEVIAEYINKRSLRYYEAYYQMKWDVLTAVIEGTDEPAFYNSYVGGKFYRPVESYQDPEFKRKISEANLGEKNPMFGKSHTKEVRKKISESNKGNIFSKEHKRKLSESRLGEKNSKYQGKAEFYIDGKQMVVNCLGAWCNENGYDRGSVNSIARTYRDGFIMTIRKGERVKAKTFSCKGPLGTITKVRWLGKEEKNGD